jgi:hypothetical protein
VKSRTAGPVQLYISRPLRVLYYIAPNERYTPIHNSWWPAHKDVGGAVAMWCVYMDDLHCCWIARDSQQLARNGTYAKWTWWWKRLSIECCVWHRSPHHFRTSTLAVCTGSRLLLRAFGFNFPPVTYTYEPTHGGWDRLLCMDPTNETTSRGRTVCAWSRTSTGPAWSVMQRTGVLLQIWFWLFHRCAMLLLARVRT